MASSEIGLSSLSSTSYQYADLFYRPSVAPLVHKVSGAICKMYHTRGEAQEAFDRALDMGGVSVV